MKAKLALIISSIVFLQCKSQQVQESTATIENTYWKLVEVGGKTVTTPDNGREIYMILAAADDSRMLKGYAGCNGLGGDYNLEGKTIKFQPVTTRMYCESQMEVENLFTQMLNAADHYRIKGKTLELYTGEELSGIFEAIPQK